MFPQGRFLRGGELFDQRIICRHFIVDAIELAQRQGLMASAAASSSRDARSEAAPSLSIAAL